jgi:hypothetical protein
MFLIGIVAQVLKRKNCNKRLVLRRPIFIATGPGRLQWPHAPSPYRITNILEALPTYVVEGNIDLATDLTPRVIGDANTARLRDLLKAHCNIDCISKDIVFVDDNITGMNPDAHLDPLIQRHIDIVLGEAALNIVRTPRGVDHARELD